MSGNWGKVAFQVATLADQIQTRLNRGETRRTIYLALMADRKIECSSAGFYRALAKIIPESKEPAWKRQIKANGSLEQKANNNPMEYEETARGEAVNRPKVVDADLPGSHSLDLPRQSLEELAFGKKIKDNPD